MCFFVSTWEKKYYLIVLCRRATVVEKAFHFSAMPQLTQARKPVANAENESLQKSVKVLKVYLTYNVLGV